MKKSLVVAKAVIFDKDKNILLIRRSESDPRRPLQWDLPGGWVEDDEDFVVAVAREIDEETGIKILPKNLHLIYTSTAMRDAGNTCWLFFAGQTKEKKVTLSYEHVESQWTALHTAIGLIEYPVQKDLLNYIDENSLLD